MGLPAFFACFVAHTMITPRLRSRVTFLPPLLRCFAMMLDFAFAATPCHALHATLLLDIDCYADARHYAFLMLLPARRHKATSCYIRAQIDAFSPPPCCYDTCFADLSLRQIFSRHCRSFFATVDYCYFSYYACRYTPSHDGDIIDAYFAAGAFAYALLLTLADAAFSDATMFRFIFRRFAAAAFDYVAIF